MNDQLEAALLELDRGATLESYAAVIAAVEHVRTLPGAEIVEPGLATRLIGVALRYDQPADIVEAHLRHYLAVSDPDDPDESWRRCMSAASVATVHPSLVRYLEAERARLAAAPDFPERNHVLAISARVLARISAGR